MGITNNVTYSEEIPSYLSQKLPKLLHPRIKDFDDAINNGIKGADKTLKNIKGAWVKDQQLTVNEGKITEYRVVMKVTFVLQDWPAGGEGSQIREGRRIAVVACLWPNCVPSLIRIKAQIEADNLGTNVPGCFNRRPYTQGAPGAVR